MKNETGQKYFVHSKIRTIHSNQFGLFVSKTAFIIASSKYSLSPQAQARLLLKITFVMSSFPQHGLSQLGKEKAFTKWIFRRTGSTSADVATGCSGFSLRSPVAVPAGVSVF
ncbi:hypothetical protein [Virgibacillus sp. LDC-1]|uniref:hypothetical protein n=1 Tax=Virgibacillus sp. LDC-1 TaxID=3039856 RepID=UPI0024DEBC85|nr:hypothetical protein [Virgibacillus sp. LDC-1]